MAVCFTIGLPTQCKKKKLRAANARPGTLNVLSLAFVVGQTVSAHSSSGTATAPGALTMFSKALPTCVCCSRQRWVSQFLSNSVAFCVPLVTPPTSGIAFTSTHHKTVTLQSWSRIALVGVFGVLRKVLIGFGSNLCKKILVLTFVPCSLW